MPMTDKQASAFFETAPVLMPVPGVNPMPGETWRAYNERIGKMIAASRRLLLD